MRIGVLGGGQLGRMLALAGIPLGFEFRFRDRSPEAPARQTGELIVGDWEDEALLARFLDGLDVVTCEFENVPERLARHLADRVPVWPPPHALGTAQDRLIEKQFFFGLRIPGPVFRAVSSVADLAGALEEIGVPAVLKTRRLGYDGKGQFVLRSPDDVPRAWQAVAGAPSILEEFVPFDREVSLLAVRSAQGETAFYPLVQNRHAGGILRESRAPAPKCSPTMVRQAEDAGRRVLDELGYVGVLAIEFFVRDGQLLVNEMAPRVHNSGHWTIEGAATSQFENHVRAIAGMPLGSTAPIGESCMLNLIGELPDAAGVLRVPGAHWHAYGKPPRPGRKVGHVTVTAADREALAPRVEAVRAALGWPAGE
ncbi:MAG: 5-(carboxyamino)imidazole ribonucleotide synthase [Candidatus Sumerlaeia bacterium]|nr:5-(carboxyamino)imidazole ribonucleotide synthase [Candidatus Sumerlaeia bacterium]